MQALTNKKSFQDNYASLLDKTLKSYIDAFAPALGGNGIAVYATGGYGRGEIAPFSDIDLFILATEKPGSAQAKAIEILVADLWDAGLKPSLSLRSLDECAADLTGDLHFATALLERRKIAGDARLAAQLDHIYRNYMKVTSASAFIAAKLHEQDERHARMGDTRYQLQPDIKEGKGALRDIQTLQWLARFLYGARKPSDLVRLKIFRSDEAKSLEEAHGFFWQVRCHLHLIAGRAEDRLSFDLQPDIAARMGYRQTDPNRRAEAFMRDYFRIANQTGYLTRILCADIEARSLAAGATAGSRRMERAETADGFLIRHGRLDFPDTMRMEKSPDEILRLFRAGQINGLAIHPEAHRDIRTFLKKHPRKLARRGASCLLLAEMLQDGRRGEQAMRRLNEARLLEAVIPEWANIYAHMQYDMYHAYTADEHTIRVVGALHRLRGQDTETAQAAPFGAVLARTVQNWAPLLCAALLHDTGKGTGGDHAAAGTAIMRRYAPLLGLSPADSELAAWLVDNHLLMTATAYKRDLTDPQTLDDFVAAVQSPQRLRLLTLLTTADIMAVGPGRWNGWKAGLLHDLYHQAAARMAGDRQEPDIIASLLSRLPEGNATALRITGQTAAGFTEVIVRAPDRKGLFAELAGAIAIAGASIAEARIATLPDGMALDVFQVQDAHGQPFTETALLTARLKAALAQKLDITAEIGHRRKTARRRKIAAMPTVVLVDNSASASHTVIEAQANDRIGLLHDMAKALHDMGIQISAAKVSTFGARAVDVFYVKDVYGIKLTHPDKIKAVKERLEATLT